MVPTLPAITMLLAKESKRVMSVHVVGQSVRLSVTVKIAVFWENVPAENVSALAVTAVPPTVSTPKMLAIVPFGGFVSVPDGDWKLRVVCA